MRQHQDKVYKYIYISVYYFQLNQTTFFCVKKQITKKLLQNQIYCIWYWQWEEQALSNYEKLISYSKLILKTLSAINTHTNAQNDFRLTESHKMLDLLNLSVI